MMSDKKLLTYPEVAAMLRCSEKTVYNRVKAGEINPFHNGRLVLFNEKCIEEFLNRHGSKTPNTLTDLLNPKVN